MLRLVVGGMQGFASSKNVCFNKSLMAVKFHGCRLGCHMVEIGFMMLVSFSQNPLHHVIGNCVNLCLLKDFWPDTARECVLFTCCQKDGKIHFADQCRRLVLIRLLLA